MLVPQLLRDSDQSLHWPKTYLSEQVTHGGNILFSFPINPGHSNAHWQTEGILSLSFKTTSSLRKLCCHGGKFSSKEKGWVKHLLLKLQQLHVASHAAVALGHDVLGFITCRSPKACPSKKPVIYVLLLQMRPHTQKTRSVFVAHGCLRLES